MLPNAIVPRSSRGAAISGSSGAMAQDRGGRNETLAGIEGFVHGIGLPRQAIVGRAKAHLPLPPNHDKRISDLDCLGHA